MSLDRLVPCPDVLSDNGYPSEAELTSIREWPIVELRDIGPLLVYCEDRWEYHYWKRADRRHRRYRGSSLTRRYEISTMGWSGNESIIDALSANEMFWMICWESSARGGHYVFEVPAE